MASDPYSFEEDDLVLPLTEEEYQNLTYGKRIIIDRASVIVKEVRKGD